MADPPTSESNRQRREDSNQNMSLLKLPAELRNRIWAYALPCDEIFTTCVDSYTLKVTRRTQVCHTIRSAESYRKHFALTQVCRQVRQDTVQVAYASNIFVLGVRTASRKETTPDTWVQTRPDEAAKAVSKVIIAQGRGDIWHKCEQLNVLFDFKVETAVPVFSGCHVCFDEDLQDNYSKTARCVSRETDKERLLTLIKVFRER